MEGWNTNKKIDLLPYPLLIIFKILSMLVVLSVLGTPTTNIGSKYIELDTSLSAIITTKCCFQFSINILSYLTWCCKFLFISFCWCRWYAAILAFPLFCMFTHLIFGLISGSKSSVTLALLITGFFIGVFLSLWFNQSGK